jgi:RHS repeat-associated protein
MSAQLHATASGEASPIAGVVRENSPASYYRARYYDPTVGRFLAEDQIGNDEGADPYAYTRNDPINFSDPTGLYRLIGFPAGKAQQMRDAINSAINTLGKTCSGCAGPNGPKIAQTLQNATFVYVRNLKSLHARFEECANARPINTKIIHVGSAAFDPNKCCRLDSSLAHEATHKVIQSEDEHGLFGPLDVEKKCFNCGPGA